MSKLKMLLFADALSYTIIYQSEIDYLDAIKYIDFILHWSYLTTVLKSNEVIIMQ